MAKRPDPASRRPPHPLTSKPQPALTVKNPRAAGIDVHDGVHWVAVPPDRDPQPVRPFGAFTVDLEAIADWFTQCGVDTVAMESTGVYWIPLYELLERRGFRVYLVDARAVAKVDGRPKTDIHDCQWIQRLHSYGLLEKAFRPQDDIVVLRGFVRQRQVLISYASQHIQHMQKALVLMNLKLTLVVSDIVGKTGMAIIKAILAGERDPVVLSQWRDERCKHTREEIAKALMGNWREEHLLALRQAVELYEFYHRKISECDQAIDAYLSRLPNRAGDRPMEKRPAKRKNKDNEPMFDARKRLYEMLGVDLTAIDGISVGVALTIASELGCDVSAFRNEKAFSNWLGLAPNHKITGGKIKSRKTRPGANRIATGLRMAAASLLRTPTALGAFGRRMRSRVGSPKAITAIAHKLAKLVYRMLKYGEDYVRQGAEEYEAKYQERRLDALRRTATALGFRLEPQAAQ
ncbi:MAG: IS110 family transposase [Isosphaeraceae bacterium]